MNSRQAISYLEHVDPLIVILIEKIFRQARHTFANASEGHFMKVFITDMYLKLQLALYFWLLALEIFPSMWN